jgi:hypothetical protein
MSPIDLAAVYANAAGKRDRDEPLTVFEWRVVQWFDNSFGCASCAAGTTREETR